MPRHPRKPDSRRALKTDTDVKLYLVPALAAFVVSENYDRQDTALSRYLKCPEVRQAS